MPNESETEEERARYAAEHLKIMKNPTGSLAREYLKLIQEQRVENNEPEFLNYCTICRWSGINSECPNCKGDRGLILYNRAGWDSHK
jgi:hypothetical protein